MNETLSYIGFVALVFGTSVVSGIVGMIGGMILLAAMGQWFPPAVLIPLHGVIQFVSNGSRVVMLRRHIDRARLYWFLPGALAATGLGLLWLPNVSSQVMNIVIGAACLAIVWIPVRKKSGPTATENGRLGLWSALLGFGSTFLHLIVGAVGPLLDALTLGGFKDKESLIGTKAAFQTVSHGLKLVVYSFGGFVLLAWIGYIALAIPASILGNKLGQTIMNRIPHKPFMLAMRILVSLLSMGMLARALWQ